MPVIQTIESRRSIDIGGIPDTRFDNSIGHGLSQIGGAISDAGQAQNALAMRRLQMQQQADEFATNQAFQRWQDDNALEFGQSQQKIDPSGRGFTDTVSGIYTKRSEEFLKTVPAALQPKFQELVATARNQWVDKGAATEIDQRNNWYRTGITERQQTLQNQVFNDPSMFDSAKQDAYRTIDASGLSPTEKQELKKKTDEMFSLTIGEREIRNAEANPETADGAAGRLGVTGAVTTSRGGDAMSLLRRFEGFRDTPYWDVTAHRVGYGSDTVTTADGRVVRVEKGMKISRGDAERDLARRSKEFERGAAVKVGVERWNNLAPNVQAALVSITYNYGSLPDNVAAAARTGDPVKIAAAVEFRGHDNNGVNAKRRAQEAAIIRGSEQIKGNAPAFDPTSMDSRYSNLSLSQRLSLYDQMQAASQRGQVAIEAQNTAAYNSQKGALQLGIQTGEVSSPQQILTSGMNDADKATLISALRARQGDDAIIGEAVSKYAQGSLTVDPYSTDGRKKVDGVGKWIDRTVPQDQQQAAYEGLVHQTGTVPQSVLNQIRAGADSQVAAEVEAALQAASRFAKVNPSALGRRDGGEAVQRKVDDFDYYVNTLNLSPSDAAKRIAAQNDPNKVRDRKALEPAAKEFRKQLEGADIGSLFDDSWLPFNTPKVGFTEGQAAGIAADYLAIAEEQFYSTGGNVELAKSRANQEMKRLYGVSEIGGSKTIMKFPPEKYWPAMQDASDPYGYAKEQLVSDLASAFPDDSSLHPKKTDKGEIYTDGMTGRQFFADEAEFRKSISQDVLSRVILVSTPETGAEVKSNQLPGYTVLYKDAKGNLQTLYGKQWRPDPNVVVEEVNRLQQDRLGRAEIYQQTGQGLADYLSGGEIPMGAGSAWDNPEAQQIIPQQQKAPTATVPSTPNPTVHSNLGEQRKELFQNAKDSGLLNGRGM